MPPTMSMDQYQEQIFQLYIVESKTPKQVRDALKADHDFEAS